MSDEKAPGRGYVPPPPIDQKLVVGSCGVAQFPNGAYEWQCTLPKGHEGRHADEQGIEFAQGYVKQENGSYVREGLQIEPPLPDLGPGTEFNAIPGPITTLPALDFSHELRAQHAAEIRDRSWEDEVIANAFEPVNDYKQDADKPPLMQAVFVPFGKTLLALAAMMEDMKHKHKLEGAKDPFQEWRQLPGAKWRWADAGARHAVKPPFSINTDDGRWPHILHAIWSLMAAYEKHLEESTTEERR